MKKILSMMVLIAYALGAQSQTKTQVETTIDTTIVENGAGKITPTLMRFVLRKIVDYSANKSPNSHTHLSTDITDWTAAWAARFAAQSTSGLAEGSNLYFTNARVATYGDARYGQLANANSFTGNNTFGGSASPTHAVTFPSGASWVSYNTTDQTTNFSRIGGKWNADTYEIITERGGSNITDTHIAIGSAISGINRLTIRANSTPAIFTFSSGSFGGAGFATMTTALGSGNPILQNVLSLYPTISQSGTAGYRGVFISPFEQTTGSGSKLPLDVGTNSAGNGGGTHTSRFSVASNGEINFGTLGRMFSNGNFFLGSSPVDAGFKLDVNGTARLQSGLVTTTINTSSTSSLNLAVNGVTRFSVNQYGEINRSDGESDGYFVYTTRNTGVTGNYGLYLNKTNNYLSLVAATQQLVTLNASSTNVGINNITPATSAILDVSSTTKGFLPPRMTQAQRNAIASPATGLTLYCTDCTATDSSTGVMQTYNGSTWKNNW